MDIVSVPQRWEIHLKKRGAMMEWWETPLFLYFFQNNMITLGLRACSVNFKQPMTIELLTLEINYVRVAAD